MVPGCGAKISLIGALTPGGEFAFSSSAESRRLGHGFVAGVAGGVPRQAQAAEPVRHQALA